MPLFVERADARCSTSSSDVACVVVEPDRVRQRLADLLDEERELTDAVAATWQATDEVRAAARRRGDAVLEGRVDVALEPTVGALSGADCT